MLDKDFNWCFNHENLFRKWLGCIHNMHLQLNDIFPLDSSSDSNSTFLLWQEAKQYALEIANSVDPLNLFKIKMRDILTIKPDKSEIIMLFVNTMLMSIKDKKLETFANLGNKACRDAIRDFLRSHSIKKDKISIHEIYNLDNKSQQYLYFILLISGQIESDYDYSLPDGGITETKTITITKADETITKAKTKTETDAGTITKTITKTDGSVTLPDVLDTNEFKKYLRLAKENGLIKDVNGKLEWIQIGDYGGSSQLAYFLGRAFGYKHSVNGNIGNQFPGKELDELFGVNRIYRLLVQVHEAPKPQKWRKKIDELFDKK